MTDVENYLVFPRILPCPTDRGQPGMDAQSPGGGTNRLPEYTKTGRADGGNDDSYEGYSARGTGGKEVHVRSVSRKTVWTAGSVVRSPAPDRFHGAACRSSSFNGGSAAVRMVLSGDWQRDSSDGGNFTQSGGPWYWIWHLWTRHPSSMGEKSHAGADPEASVDHDYPKWRHCGGHGAGAAGN